MLPSIMTVTEQTAKSVAKICKNNELVAILTDEESVWHGVHVMQHYLNDLTVSKFLAKVNIHAKPQERVNAFISVHTQMDL